MLHFNTDYHLFGIGGRLCMNLDAKIPSGPIKDKWDKHRFDMKLINPANKRK